MDDVRVIEAKLLQSEAENQKLREQLHGLISLVKKAWTGDHSAAIDVAMIVGVAPPTLEISSVTDEIVAVPKPQCINNWLRLTVGLINKERQTTIKAQQMLYLRDREAFIDEQMEDSKYNREPKLWQTEQRTNLLCDLVESENVKRNELKLKLGVSSSETRSSMPKTRAGSAKQTRSAEQLRLKQTKLTNTAKVDECLVVRSRPSELSQEQRLPVAGNQSLSEGKNKPRAKSAGCVSVANRKFAAKKTADRRRPESAMNRASGKYERPRSGVKKNNTGRIENKLNKTENDIALTVQLLQQRLGIDERGMV